VLVVPAEDVKLQGPVTIPHSFHVPGALRAVALVEPGAGVGDVECSIWAFSRADRKRTIMNLYALADWMEFNGSELDRRESTDKVLKKINKRRARK
jgi:hypothetical protein